MDYEKILAAMWEIMKKMPMGTATREQWEAWRYLRGIFDPEKQKEDA